ncbi:uncharacterized protein A4U43_C03F13870 [Asparagus officinalis]|uniref:Peptidase S26 domain-containing protein n=1 Tax=Asparagus officinalis TaxID=4686 RepID=A0A5P1FE40_ASPOF|nr:mitochondrial inner membrane protease subunit 1-like [Asparagus officinalis]ONK75149.1 uncharacterized protein A4U43_C03F13870 [Asparagus officinalis]
MMPTINPSGELVLLDLVTHRRGKVRVGDIVIVRSPEKPTKVVAKRVLGLEGDSVSFLTQPAISTEIETVVVPKGHVWVQGDNIYDSRDSRTFGPVPYGLINGRVLLRVWPPERCGFIEHNVPLQQVASGEMEQNAISD